MWIRTIAYQELASMLIHEGRNDEAFDLLQEAVSRIPENQRLRIMLAHSLDGAGRPRDAAAVVEEFGSTALQQSTSPRYKYSTWPDLDSGRVQEILSEADVVSRAPLQEALQ